MTIQLPVDNTIQGFGWVTSIRRLAEAINYIFNNGQLRARSYTVSGLPSASTAGAGAMVYVSDAGGNGPCIAFSDGSNWKRCDNAGTTVS